MEASKEELVKEEILINAQGLFKQFGFKKTTMDEIALACRKAKSTIYLHFKNKDEVFNEVIYMELRNLRSEVKVSVQNEKLLKDKIETYFLEFYKKINDRVNLYRIMRNELFELSVTRKHFDNIVKFEKSYIVKLLEDGFQNKELTGIRFEEIPAYAEIYLVAMFGVIRYYIDQDGEMDIDNLEDVVRLMISRMII